VQCRRLPLPLPPLLNGPSLAIKLLAVFFPACSFSLIIRPPLFTLSAHVILAISLWDFVRRAFKIVISISTYIQLTIKNSLEQGFINKLQPRIHRGARNRKRKKRALQLLTLSDLHCCRIYIYIYIFRCNCTFALITHIINNRKRFFSHRRGLIYRVSLVPARFTYRAAATPTCHVGY